MDADVLATRYGSCHNLAAEINELLASAEFFLQRRLHTSSQLVPITIQSDSARTNV